MVLTKPELVASFQKEVRILIHLAGKVDRTAVDYRPTPKQRSTLELLRYLSIVGPELVKAAKTGFDPAVFTAAAGEAERKNFDQVVASIAELSNTFPKLLNDWSDADFRVEIEMFGQKSTRGSFLVNTVLCAYAAYRTQLFCYLKACGREELNTMNLWAGMDAPMAAA
jgi:hypothetical protein